MTVSSLIGESFAVLLAAYLSLLLISSWLPKVLDFSRFTSVVSGYRMLPNTAVSLAAFFIVFLEVVLTFTLLLPSSRSYSLALTAILLLFYAMVVGFALYRGDKGMPCGCGTEDQVISPNLVLKNGVLALVAVLAVFVSPEFQLGIWETAMISIMGFSLYFMENTIRQLIGNSEKDLTQIRTRNQK